MPWQVAPLRVRGLKPVGRGRLCRTREVAPLRVRGLKLFSMSLIPEAIRVAPLRVRGLKRRLLLSCPLPDRRTFTGAWIETDIQDLRRVSHVVAPLRVRGLKHRPPQGVFYLSVAPLRVRGLKLTSSLQKQSV